MDYAVGYWSEDEHAESSDGEVVIPTSAKIRTWLEQTQGSIWDKYRDAQEELRCRRVRETDINSPARPKRQLI